MSFAKWTFTLAPIYGVLALLPLYFLEEQTGRTDPPPITHPEFYYGFVGVALAWQVGYFLCGRDPVRFRPFMLVCALAKGSWLLTATTLFLQHRCSATIFGSSLVDGFLGVFFVVSYFRTPGGSATS
jgi:hypothetical protein